MGGKERRRMGREEEREEMRGRDWVERNRSRKGVEARLIGIEIQRIGATGQVIAKDDRPCI